MKKKKKRESRTKVLNFKRCNKSSNYYKKIQLLKVYFSYFYYYKKTGTKQNCTFNFLKD